MFTTVKSTDLRRVVIKSLCSKVKEDPNLKHNETCHSSVHQLDEHKQEVKGESTGWNRGTAFQERCWSRVGFPRRPCRGDAGMLQCCL